MSTYSNMYLIPAETYNGLVANAPDPNSANMVHIRQINAFDVNQGGRVAINNNDNIRNQGPGPGGPAAPGGGPGGPGGRRPPGQRMHPAAQDFIGQQQQQPPGGPDAPPPGIVRRFGAVGGPQVEVSRFVVPPPPALGGLPPNPPMVYQMNQGPPGPPIVQQQQQPFVPMPGTFPPPQQQQHQPNVPPNTFRVPVQVHASNDAVSAPIAAAAPILPPVQNIARSVSDLVDNLRSRNNITVRRIPGVPQEPEQEVRPEMRQRFDSASSASSGVYDEGDDSMFFPSTHRFPSNRRRSPSPATAAANARRAAANAAEARRHSTSTHGVNTATSTEGASNARGQNDISRNSRRVITERRKQENAERREREREERDRAQREDNEQTTIRPHFDCGG